MGDFNEILDNSEKIGGVENHRPSLLQGFRDTISDCGFRDLGFTGPKFMWSNRRVNDPIYARLDIFFATDDWISLFPSYVVRELSIATLEHLAIYLTTETIVWTHETRLGKINRFDLAWLNHEDCYDVFVNLLQHTHSQDCKNLVSKVSYVRDMMITWY